MVRYCTAKKYENGHEIEVSGRFHGWFPEFIEFDAGPGNYTVARIELKDGTIVDCVADSVQFFDGDCSQCMKREASAKMFDMHWIGKDDCPYIKEGRCPNESV